MLGTDGTGRAKHRKDEPGMGDRRKGRSRFPPSAMGAEKPALPLQRAARASPGKKSLLKTLMS